MTEPANASEQAGIALETGGGVMKVYLEGFEELLEVMRSLGPKITSRLLRGALKRAAEPMLHAARSLVPVDTGFLASQILLVTMASTRVKGSYSAVVTTKGRGLYQGEAFYGAFLELGHFAGPRVRRATASRPREKALERPWIEPQPFLRPAFDMNVELMASSLEAEIAAVFDQEWPKEKAVALGKPMPLAAAMEQPSGWMETAGFAPT